MNPDDYNCITIETDVKETDSCRKTAIQLRIIKMEIQTTRLFIRRPGHEDILSLENLWRNEKVREFLGGIITDELLVRGSPLYKITGICINLANGLLLKKTPIK